MPGGPEGAGFSGEIHEPGSELLRLAGDLGYVETPDMEELRRQATEAYTHARELKDRYIAAGQAIVEARGDQVAIMRGSIGLTITTALIARDSGNKVGYAHVLDDARQDAYQQGLDEVADRLQDEIDAAESAGS